MLEQVPNFDARILSSPLFKHMKWDLNFLQKLFSKGLSVIQVICNAIPGHDQDCEWLNRNLKHSVENDVG